MPDLSEKIATGNENAALWVKRQTPRALRRFVETLCGVDGGDAFSSFTSQLAAMKFTELVVAHRDDAEEIFAGVNIKAERKAERA